MPRPAAVLSALALSALAPCGRRAEPPQLLPAAPDRQIRSSESGKGGMMLFDAKAPLTCQAEGPLLVVFLGSIQRGPLATEK
ncbi:hypothetical protein GHT09_001951 [Marmota monax]|uniref:DUF4232 domain-containing protein n=1 Tax=Marmota monax TaxID=9995 RepID=A0A834PUJ7_MARMO|nr:hypothetical protein GHT09_001951 [Marmota monax]